MPMINPDTPKIADEGRMILKIELLSKFLGFIDDTSPGLINSELLVEQKSPQLIASKLINCDDDIYDGGS